MNLTLSTLENTLIAKALSDTAWAHFKFGRYSLAENYHRLASRYWYALNADILGLQHELRADKALMLASD